MAETKFTDFTGITSMNAADLIVLVDDSVTDNRSISYANFFKNESGNWTFSQLSDGDNIIFTLDNVGGTPQTLLTLDPDLKSLIIGMILNLGDGGELTISSGAITVTHSVHTVDTEADAATDDLDTITGISNSDILILEPADSTRDIVVKHGTGNIYLDGGVDFTMDHIRDKIVLIRRSGVWNELSRSSNS
jgi:hypothetical protein